MLFLLVSSLTYEQQDFVKDIFDENDKYFLHIASGYMQNMSEAEDAVSMSYIKIIEKIERIESIGNRQMVKSYCITIVKNTCLDILRKNKRSSTTDDIDKFTETYAESVEDELIKKLDIGSTIKIVRTLSDDEKRLIHFKFDLEMGYKEISSLLDITEETAKKRGQRVVSKIRNLLVKENLLWVEILI